ncbi:MAG: coenzyme F420-0:L-glutamate ligase [Methanophagales archaeon]|nr:coenzyme F420-0:L-glutamate ligase [Methanophagales archaeon]RJS69995.1 MAG: coenzyme F420-0:L-glutamate ligase [Methanophagales archaeon]
MKKKSFSFSDHLEITGIDGLPEIKEGDDLTSLFFNALKEKRMTLEDHDAIVFTSKIISKSEGRVVDFSDVKVSEDAERIAKETEKDPKIVQLILNEAKEIVRMMKNHIIVETKHGFVCANAGVDESNVEEGKAVLLPKDPQKSAEWLKKEIEAGSGKEISVLISDSFGRAFRDGVTGACIGVSGIPALLDRRGEVDRFGKIAKITKEAIADEICAAANLVMGEFKEGMPIVLVRGLKLERSESNIKEILFKKKDDLFR